MNRPVDIKDIQPV